MRIEPGIVIETAEVAKPKPKPLKVVISYVVKDWDAEETYGPFNNKTLAQEWVDKKWTEDDAEFEIQEVLSPNSFGYNL